VALLHGGGCGMVDTSNEDAAGIFKLHLIIL